MTPPDIIKADGQAYLTDLRQGLLTVAFNRPEAGNSIPSEAVESLTALFRSVNGNAAIRAVLIRGEGKHFCAGGDVRGFSESLSLSVEARCADFRARLDRANALVEAYMAVEVPVTAVCQGAVAGAGLMFALGADYVVADETVNFIFSHQRVGLTPDAGVSLLLPRVIGQRRASELVLTAARVEAEEAFRLGMVSRLVAGDALEEEGRKAASRFAQAPVNAVKRAKRLLVESVGRTAREQLEAERDAIVASVAEPDFEEGVRAFMEKRKAVFPSTQ